MGKKFCLVLDGVGSNEVVGKQEGREFADFLWDAHGLRSQECLDAEQILIVKIVSTDFNSRSRKGLWRRRIFLQREFWWYSAVGNDQADRTDQ